MKLSKLTSSFLVGVLGAAQTSFASETEMAGATTADPVICDSSTREFVLTADDPVFQCPSNADLAEEDVLACKKIVQCMMEEGIIVDSDTMIKFHSTVIGGSTQRTTEVPTRCIEE